MSYINLREEHNALVERVERALRVSIANSKKESKFVQSNAIEVNIFGLTELVVIDDELIFLDSAGYHHSLYADCTLEDLIDILTQL
jgi:hypothetical protein